MRTIKRNEKKQLVCAECGGNRFLGNINTHIEFHLNNEGVVHIDDVDINEDAIECIYCYDCLKEIGYGVRELHEMVIDIEDEEQGQE